MKNIIVFAVISITSILIISLTYLNRYAFITSTSTIETTGLGSADFESDHIVWEGSFVRENTTLVDAYAALTKDREIVLNYLMEQSISKEEIVFGSVSTSDLTENIYNDEGNRIGDKFLGYRLRQEVKIESGNIELVEAASRSITDVLNSGVEFYSYEPRYYFTKLKDLKLDLLSKATEDAKTRATIIAKEAGADIGKLISADMGVLQIIGQYSDDDYSWGGAFNTSSKLKTASITIDLRYELVN